jgi:LacI family transcriptional regulator
MSSIPKVILMIETSSGYGRGLLRGIARYSRLHGPWAFYSEPGGQGDVIPNIDQWRADGIITRETRINQKIFDMGLPTILVVDAQKKYANVPYVVGDNLTIGRTASWYFIEQGYQHFAYCGYGDIWWSLERAQSFAQHNLQAGFQTSIYQPSRSAVRRSWEKERQNMTHWLKSLTLPAALFASNDARARHVLEVCKIAGLRVPDDIAVIGVDNDELLCELSQPPLSSIPQNTERAGYEAAELLDGMMRGKKPSRREISVSVMDVVTRQSTETLAINDPEVAKAVRFIRDNARRIIQVTDVVEATTLSRNALLMRFRKTLGWSIHQEITKTQIDLFARMLIETHLSIDQIAQTLGYTGLKNVARRFRQIKGMTPLAWRRKFAAP